MRTDKHKPTIFIYRDYLLPRSETFIRAQTEGLHHFSAYYVGSRCINGLELPKDRVLLINQGGMLGRLKEISFKITGLNFSRKYDFSNRKPNLIHAHFANDGLFASYLARHLKIPLIVTCHGYDVTVQDDKANSYGQKLFIRRRHKLFQYGSLFIAVSKFIKQQMINQGYPEDKIVQHYIGIDVQQFKPDPYIKREPIVLFVGRLVEKKGAGYLIEAMGKVQQFNPNVELIVIGDGPLRKGLEKQASKSLNKYRFLGVQPPAVVKDWLNRAKVFSVPSVVAENGDAEGFGMVFAESNAMGLPVVSFASGGIPEAVAHEETGYLVPERDIDGLAFYIQRLLEDQRLWEEFSTNGRYRVNKLFNINSKIKELENIYKKLLTT